MKDKLIKKWDKEYCELYNEQYEDEIYKNENELYNIDNTLNMTDEEWKVYCRKL